jgi:hypothetical protein
MVAARDCVLLTTSFGLLASGADRDGGAAAIDLCALLLVNGLIHVLTLTEHTIDKLDVCYRALPDEKPFNSAYDT